MAVGVLLVLVALAAGGLVWVVRQRRAHPPAPLRPERLREIFDRQARGPSTGERMALWMMRLGLAVPGAILALLVERTYIRFMGASLVAWVILATLLGIWARRSGRVEAAQQRAIARSEAFWSQPDAAERARAGVPFGRPPRDRRPRRPAT
jgi:uncharacterized membrane protein YqjE